MDSPCAACNGTGERQKTLSNVLLADSAREWAYEIIADFFRDWCTAFNKAVCYGVESWSIVGSIDPPEGTLHIVQDTSARGCHNTERHEIPLRYLAEPNHETRMGMMRADFAKDRLEKQRTDRRAVKRRITELRDEANHLEASLENKS